MIKKELIEEEEEGYVTYKMASVELGDKSGEIGLDDDNWEAGRAILMERESSILMFRAAIVTRSAERELMDRNPGYGGGRSANREGCILQ